eukprot:s474_g17.t1
MIDGSAIGSDDEDQSLSGPVDALVVEEAFKVCTQALTSGGSLPKNTNKKIVKWLHHHGAIDVFESGEIVLSREAVNHGVHASGAVLETNLRTVKSTWEIQDTFKKNGWTFVDDIRSADLNAKKLVRDNGKAYYSLVFHFAESLFLYESEGYFHHRQIDKYYLALEAALIHDPEQIVDIPTSKDANFYVRLRQFLCGEKDEDPREEIEQPKRTGVVWPFIS